jgi:Carboxypeptidase regulatory-like domain
MADVRSSRVPWFTSFCAAAMRDLVRSAGRSLPLHTSSARITVAAMLALVTTTRVAVAQDVSRPDTLAGRVTSLETSAAIRGATVFVTRGPDRLVQQDTTDADGRWQLVFQPGTGDYLVFVSAPGAVSFRKRVMRSGAEQRFVVDAVLKGGGVAQLAAVRVQAAAPRPERVSRTTPMPTTGSNERVAEGVFAAVSPTSAGDRSDDPWSHRGTERPHRARRGG